MTFYENQTFTIGQFAALHGINKKTLMWYDEIGLLKPAFVRENGYRCYTFHQSAELETILMLRDLQVSLAEIAEFMAHRSARTLATLLSEKGAALDARIAHLQALRAVMARRQTEMEALCTLDLETISVVEKTAPQYFVTVATNHDADFGKEIMRIIEASKAHVSTRLHDAAYGALLPVSAIATGRFDDYAALTIALPEPVNEDSLHIQPAGWYLRAYHRGSWEGLAARYQAMGGYASAHGYTLCGYAYEQGINDAVITDMSDYITRIEIPLQE